MNDLKIVARINQDIRLGAYLGVRGTPTVYINGRLSKARTLQALQTEVEIELRKVKKEVRSKGKG
jgi:protein-disulfide isomerase